MVVTYDDYKNVYGGTTIPSSKFNGYSIKANDYVTYITQGRSEEAEYASQVKKAICAVADAIFKFEDKEAITSESVSGLSQSYDLKSTQSAKLKAAKYYLGLTGLMYTGV